jgi:pimeloyl-[acyl-carrier protein] synthase
MTTLRQTAKKNEAEYSLFQQLDPEVMANPYPLYKKLREYEPVHWDPYMHSWVVTSYAECVTVLTKYKAARTPTPEYLDAMGLSVLAPYASMMLKQIMFMDPPEHASKRAMCAVAFTPKRMDALRQRTEAIANDLLDRVVDNGRMDLIADFAGQFPAIVLASLLGLPLSDCANLKRWAVDVAELIGNFEHNPDRIKALTASLEEIRVYLTEKVAEQRNAPQEGMLSALLEAEANGLKLTDEEIIANAILVCAGGLEEPANLIGCGMYSLLRDPVQLALLRDRPEIAAMAVEELIRYEAPTQHTGRLAPEDVMLGGKQIRKGSLVTVVVAAANRDPLRFNEPDQLDLTRADNRHLSFGWASHYCIGAPLARLAGQVAFTTLLQRLPALELVTTKPQWRGMAALRGIASLEVAFDRNLAKIAQKERAHV